MGGRWRVNTRAVPGAHNRATSSPRSRFRLEIAHLGDAKQTIVCQQACVRHTDDLPGIPVQLARRLLLRPSLEHPVGARLRACQTPDAPARCATVEQRPPRFVTADHRGHQDPGGDRLMTGVSPLARASSRSHSPAVVTSNPTRAIIRRGQRFRGTAACPAETRCWRRLIRQACRPGLRQAFVVVLLIARATDRPDTPHLRPDRLGSFPRSRSTQGTIDLRCERIFLSIHHRPRARLGLPGDRGLRAGHARPPARKAEASAPGRGFPPLLVRGTLRFQSLFERGVP